MIDGDDARWSARLSSVEPANRAKAEEAVRRLYSCAGFLGELRSVVWAESFPQFGRMVRLMERDVSWHFVHRFMRRSFPKMDCAFGTALRRSIEPLGDIVLDRPEAPDRGEENAYYGLWEEVPDPLPWSKSVLVPNAYASRTLAAIEQGIASGALPQSGFQALLLHILSECAAFYPLPGVAILCENPQGFLPFGEGASAPGVRVDFQNGESSYFWNDLSVTKSQAEVLKRPDLLPSCEILTAFAPGIRSHLIEDIGATAVAQGAGGAALLELDDPEFRREMIEAYGATSLIFDSSVFPTSVEDDFGTLYRVAIEGDEDVCVVKVLNATPEPDGTFRDYFLRVPPDVSTSREAIAWTFEMEDDYGPIVQT